MSVDKNIKLEPYIVIKAPKIAKEVRIALPCHGHRADPFCSTCGAPRQYSITTHMADTVDIFRLREKIRDVLYAPSGLATEEHHIWISNQFLKGVAESPDTDDTLVYEIAPATIEEAKRVFAHAFSSQIAILEEAYRNKAEVKYGLLVWFS